MTKKPKFELTDWVIDKTPLIILERKQNKKTGKWNYKLSNGKVLKQKDLKKYK